MVMNFLTTTSEALTNPLVNLWISFVNLIPGLIGAIIILIVGYVVSYILGHAVKVVLWKIGLDKQVDKAHLSKATGKIRLSALLGEIVKWFAFLLFLQSAVDLLSLGALSVHLQGFVMWIPNLIAAILILIGGLLLAHYVTLKMREHTEIRGVKTLSSIVNIVIIFLIIVLALEQIRIDVAILKQTFLVLLTALAFGIALALGLSFGLGTKKDAAKALKKIKKFF